MKGRTKAIIAALAIIAVCVFGLVVVIREGNQQQFINDLRENIKGTEFLCENIKKTSRVAEKYTESIYESIDFLNNGVEISSFNYKNGHWSLVDFEGKPDQSTREEIREIKDEDTKSYSDYQIQINKGNIQIIINSEIVFDVKLDSENKPILLVQDQKTYEKVDVGTYTATLEKTKSDIEAYKDRVKQMDRLLNRNSYESSSSSKSKLSDSERERLAKEAAESAVQSAIKQKGYNVSKSKFTIETVRDLSKVSSDDTGYKKQEYDYAALGNVSLYDDYGSFVDRQKFNVGIMVDSSGSTRCSSVNFFD